MLSGTRWTKKARSASCWASDRRTDETRPARVLRHDDLLDLALLQVDEGPHPAILELGRDADVKELAHVFTFGFPFGKDTKIGGAEYPDVTIVPSQITALRRSNGELLRIQFDNQINPGNSGGPVLDQSGRVVGVAVAAVPGAGLNLGIPVGQLASFLKAPGLVFDPPDFNYFNRARTVEWTIRLQPATPRAKLAEGLSVAVTLSNGKGTPRTYEARPLGDGVFEAKVTAAPQDPDWLVDVRPMNVQGLSDPLILQVPDEEVRGGGTRFMLSVLRLLRDGRPLRTPENQAEAAGQHSLRLGKVTQKAGPKTNEHVRLETINLDQAEVLDVSARNPSRVQTIDAVVEAKDGA